MNYGNSARKALFGKIYGSPGADWGKVHAILKNKEASERRSSSSSSGGCTGGYTPTFTPRGPRTEFEEGFKGKCKHCNYTINFHTPKKKWCPLY